MSRLCVTDSDQSNSAAGFLSRHQHIPHFYSNHFHSAQTFHFKSGNGRLCSPKRMNFQKGFKWRHCCNNVVPWKKEHYTMKNRYQQLTPFRDLKWTSSKIGRAIDVLALHQHELHEGAFEIYVDLIIVLAPDINSVCQESESFVELAQRCTILVWSYDNVWITLQLCCFIAPI